MDLNRLFFTLLLLIGGILLNAQTYNYAFLVEFTDKNNSIYSVNQPLDFLSQRAIDRRLKYEIEITEEDFPVNKHYIDGIIDKGAQLHETSRWMNSAVFYTNSATFPGDLEQFSFVKNVSLVFQHVSKKSGKISKWNETSNASDYDYGMAYNQIAMCNAQDMHQQGFKGSGMHIAVMDGGFFNADKLGCFDSLNFNNQILDSWDFVDHEENVFDDHTHGLKVLSTLAGNIPGEIIGTAPYAYYYLYRTEDVSTEFPIEEENWIAAAEVADSAGVDVITTSLGYSQFDMPGLSYAYDDMDGNTTRITRGAEIAFSKGMLIVNSAGNEGNDPSWLHITAPSDGEHVLCVGAVDPDKAIAPFSSLGPSADGRVKPDVVAQGALSSVISSDNVVIQRNGTSFSCPIMAGMVTCLWQALPECNNQNILDLVKSYGDRYNNPDSIYGYGLPDFRMLVHTLDTIGKQKPNDNTIDAIYSNPFKSSLKFRVFVTNDQHVKIRIADALGNIVLSGNKYVYGQQYNLIELNDANKLGTGYYILTVETTDGLISSKIVKN